MHQYVSSVHTSQGEDRSSFIFPGKSGLGENLTPVLNSSAKRPYVGQQRLGKRLVEKVERVGVEYEVSAIFESSILTARKWGAGEKGFSHLLNYGKYKKR
jgi:hypothetical protein